MVYVPGGTYTRGCDNCAEQDKIYETPSHKVTVSDYHIAPTEVTIAQWNAVMGGKKNAWESEKAPKIGVSWFDANGFACKLGQLTGHQYRLLTDAEWEFESSSLAIGLTLIIIAKKINRIIVYKIKRDHLWR